MMLYSKKNMDRGITLNLDVGQMVLFMTAVFFGFLILILSALASREEGL